MLGVGGRNWGGRDAGYLKRGTNNKWNGMSPQADVANNLYIILLLFCPFDFL